VTVTFRDADGTTRLAGDLLAPAGAAVGDVLTVQADGTLTPAPGGGSQPYEKITVLATDIPFNGDTKAVFTPAAGQLVYGFFIDPVTFVQWNAGAILLLGEDDGDLAGGDGADSANYWALMQPDADLLNASPFDGTTNSDPNGNSTGCRKLAGNDLPVSGIVCNGSPVVVANGYAEIWAIETTGSPDGGTFTLLVDGDETTALDFDASDGDIQAAIEALTPNVSVTAVGPPVDVTVRYWSFTGGHHTIALGDNSLTGGTSPSVAITPPTPPGAGQIDLYFTTPITPS
jgi:hypothetical protein